DVLVGGLGFGYTLKSVLENISEGSSVLTAELMDCVIKWNSDLRYPLANAQLNDRRTTVVQGDVSKVLHESNRQFDAIILDVDNGPEAITTESNSSLYNKVGLHMIKSALKPGGTLGVWSVNPNKAFESLMLQSGFRVEIMQVPARLGKGVKHTLFL